jgi:predicted helicase
MNKAEIYYKDIGDYLSREEKLRIVSEDESILNPALKMVRIKPNEHGDWINKRNSKFEEFIPLEPEQKFDSKAQSFFFTYAIGVSTNRDAWVYNFSEATLKNSMKKMINFYNEQRKLIEYERNKNKKINIDDCLDTNPHKISWTVNLKKDIENNVGHKFTEKYFKISLYRPFTKMNLFFDTNFIERPGIWQQLLPTEDCDNIIICLSCVGANNGLSIILCKEIPNLHFIGDTQCFPIHWYEKKEKVQKNLFENTDYDYIRHDAVSDFILKQAKTRYGGRVGKEDIFYYVYGILHSPDYRKTFANDLKKMLPRLPLVEKAADFWAFSKAGRELADLHLNYEDQPAPKDVLINGKPLQKTAYPADKLSVIQMKFPAKGQKDTIIYNSYITISNIPVKAYEYIVNGKPAIEWVMERYAVTTHKGSGIINNPNDWAAEHDNPQYILDLLLSVITVSIKTVDILAGLPKVAWE